MGGPEPHKGCSIDVGKVKRHGLFVNPPKKESQTFTHPFLGDVSFFSVFKAGIFRPIWDALKNFIKVIAHG